MDEDLEYLLSDANMNWAAFDEMMKQTLFSLSEIAPPHPVFDTQLVQAQNFSLPNPLISYLTTSSAKLYQKLVKTCKYIYYAKPILVIKNLNREDRYMTSQKPEWTFEVNDCQKYLFGPNFDFNQITPQIWIVESMDVRDLMIPTVFSASVLPKIYQCDVSKLIFKNQEIFLDKFLLLTGNVVDIHIGSMAKITNFDGSCVLIEKLIENLPKLQRLHFEMSTESYSFSTESVQNLVKLDNFKKLKYIYLNYVFEVFDIETFGDYMMENPDVEYTLYFLCQPDDYVLRVEKVKEKLATVKFRKQPIIY